MGEQGFPRAHGGLRLRTLRATEIGILLVGELYVREMQDATPGASNLPSGGCGRLHFQQGAEHWNVTLHSPPISDQAELCQKPRL